MKKRASLKDWILLLVVVAATASPAVGRIIYVDADAPGSNNGSSWGNAYNYLQDALADADSAPKPVEIRVAQGIYKPDHGANQTPGDRGAAFHLINDVALKGGYAGFGEPDHDARDIGLYETILSGDLAGNDVDVNSPEDLCSEPTRAENSISVIINEDITESATLDGFLITGGNANSRTSGGGMRNMNANPTVINCMFSDNSTERGGGGMYNYSSNPTVTNCTFSGNSAKYNGGGMSNIDAYPTVINCTFSGNSANYDGGGMYNGGSSPTVTNCIFSDNLADYIGGGMGNDSSNPTVTNCIFSGNSTDYIGGGMGNEESNAIVTNCTFNGNSAEHGGGIGNRDSSPTITDCIFSGNSSPYEGGGVFNYNGNLTLANCTISNNIEGGIYCCYTNLTITNCIVCGNSYGQIIRYYNSVISVSYSNVRLIEQGAGDTESAGNIESIWPGEGNINADPLFEDANSGDYHLRYGSPCIDTGTNNPPDGLPETDLDGKPRIVNGIVDMGAYEFGPTWYVDGINGDDNNDGLRPDTAFATIQKGINSAENGDIISVFPGVYNETIDFLGKAITVQNAEDAPILRAQDYFAVLFYSGEGPSSILKNFVIENSFLAIFLEDSSPTIKNVTVANNGFGVAAYGAARPDISNSIFWNNIFGDLFGCQAGYSCIQDGCPGPGNLDIDPRFADPNSSNYHLRSRFGRYWPQYDIWVLDEAISPCIDGGDPNDTYCSEPMPNGGRVNMGASGGTIYASKKEMRWLPADLNHDDWVNLMDFAMLAENWLIYEPGTSNLPPEVRIINPQDGDSISYYETILIEADAWDTDGSVEWVGFLVDGTWIGNDSDGSDGWKTYWQSPPGGYHNLTAEATDDDGATTTSPAVEISVRIR